MSLRIRPSQCPADTVRDAWRIRPAKKDAAISTQVVRIQESEPNQGQRSRQARQAGRPRRQTSCRVVDPPLRDRIHSRRNSVLRSPPGTRRVQSSTTSILPPRCAEHAGVRSGVVWQMKRNWTGGAAVACCGHSLCCSMLGWHTSDAYIALFYCSVRNHLLC
jgi:hypothetical protein